MKVVITNFGFEGRGLSKRGTEKEGLLIDCEVSYGSKIISPLRLTAYLKLS